MTLMTTTTTLVLVYAAAAVVLFGIFTGIPLWMVFRHPDTAPDNTLPGYLRADWENLPSRQPSTKSTVDPLRTKLSQVRKLASGEH
jgi:hypothetical protein